MFTDPRTMESLMSIGGVGQSFSNYFNSKGYAVIPGGSLLDPSVPMSFVMSAGLVQVERSAALRGGRYHDRYVLLQNCFRYFDLDTIGDSEHHLTLFRMAGAFTFGNVDRQACFINIWDLLVNVFGLPSEALWVTYFKGGEVGGHIFDPDEDTCRAWQKVGIPPERIIGLGPEDNFWKQGTSVVSESEAPKCGPNTEVFFDRGSQFQCGKSCRPGCRCGRFVEIQNTLLITWYLDEEKYLLRPLDEPFVEAVIGIERLEMLLQQKPSVFEIASIFPVIEYIRQFEPESANSRSYQTKQERIIADHIRSILFLTADNAPPPGRGGRARLMRKLVRGVLTAKKLLNISDSQFVPSIIDYAAIKYSKQHEHLKHARDLAMLYILDEADLFEKTLAEGKRKLENLLQIKDGKLSSEDVVALEKEKGVPEPLLISMLQQRQVPMDYQAYQRAYAAWYQRITE